MMKKWIRIIAALSMLLLLLTGCGGSGSGGMSETAASQSTGWAEDAGELVAEEPMADENGSSFSAVRENAKLILRADLTVEAQNFEQTRQDIEDMTAAAGGYIESSGMYGEVGNRRADYTLRIPQEKFEEFLKKVGDACHVVSQNTSQEDIADQYTDRETRLATLRTKHTRLLALLEQAAQMEDIISLENALSETEYEIDSLTGELRRYDSLVGFSTISMYINEVQSLTAMAEGNSFSAQAAKAAQSGLDGIIIIMRSLILTAIMLWPLLVIAAVIGYIFWRKYQAKRRKTQNKDENSDRQP